MLRRGEPRTIIDGKEYSRDKITVRDLICMLENICEKGLADQEVFIAPEGTPCKIHKISILEGAFPIVID